MIIIIITFLGILIDILFFSVINDLIYVLLLILLFISWKFIKWQGTASIITGIILIAFCPFLIMIKSNDIAEKTAIWAIFFLLIGTVQRTYSNFRDGEKNEF